MPVTLSKYEPPTHAGLLHVQSLCPAQCSQTRHLGYICRGGMQLSKMLINCSIGHSFVMQCQMQSLQTRTCALRAVAKSAVCCLLGCRNLAAVRVPACSHGALGDRVGAVRGALTVLYFTIPSSSSHKRRAPAVIPCQTEDLGLSALSNSCNGVLLLLYLQTLLCTLFVHAALHCVCMRRSHGVY